jgi:predicted transcriptional regulator
MELKKYSFYIDTNLMDKLKPLADKKSVKVSSLIRLAISDYLYREEKKDKNA